MRQVDLNHLLLVIRQEDLDGVKRLCAQDASLVVRADPISGTSALQVRCLRTLAGLVSRCA